MNEYEQQEAERQVHQESRIFRLARKTLLLIFALVAGVMVLVFIGGLIGPQLTRYRIETERKALVNEAESKAEAARILARGTADANATIAAYLRHTGVLPAVDARYTVSQGREIGRDARIDLHVEGDGDIWVGGEVQTVVRGTLDWG